MTAPVGRFTTRQAGAIPPFQGPFPQYSPYAWLLPPELQHRPKRNFTYVIEFVTPNQLPATSTRSRTFGVNRDSAFFAIAISAVVTNTDNTTFIDTPALLVLIKDSGAGVDFMDNPVHFLNLFGRGSSGDGRFNFLTLPRHIDPGGTVAAQIENLEATARHIRLAFHGIRVYL